MFTELESRREHGVKDPIGTRRTQQHLIGSGVKCENGGQRLVSDNALFLAWVTGDDLMTKMTDVVLNTFELRTMFNIQAWMPSDFLAIWILIVEER